MQIFQLVDTTFSIDDDSVSINGKAIQIKVTTAMTLLYLLESNGEIISKDDLLDNVWTDVIVSDASAFKQIQLVRKIFANAGMPKDVLENVYGKGYKLNYLVEKFSDEQKQSFVEKTLQHKSSEKKLPFKLIVLIFASIIIVFFVFNYPNNKPIVVNFLTDIKKKDIKKLITNDWREGLEYLVKFIDDNKVHLSEEDLGFLLFQKGKAKFHLQYYDDAVKEYKSALNYFQKSDDSIAINKSRGAIHLDIARALISAKKPNSPFVEKHINQAISFFEKSEAHFSLIDSQMLLARMYAKKKAWDKSNNIYKKTIDDAQSFNDKVGQMIAINNLAANYVRTNDFKLATEYGEQGLSKALEIGRGRYIANSYSFMSDVYQRQFKSVKALRMIEQALKFQLDNKELSNLPPKIITLSFILVQTHQFEKAEELLGVITEYLRTLPESRLSHTLSLYQGINYAHQGRWHDTQVALRRALKQSQLTNSQYRVPYLKAYLSLAHYFNQEYIKALELATEVIENPKTSQQDRAIAALSLAYSYHQIDKLELAGKWFNQAQELLNPRALFTQHLLVQLRLKRLQKSSTDYQLIQAQLNSINNQIEQLKSDITIDKDIYSGLINYLKNTIQENIKTQNSDEK